MTYASEVLADSPALWWRLNDASGTTVTDSSGNARHGTYTNAPTLGVTGLVAGDTAVQLDGTNDSITYSGAVLTNATASTIEIWYKQLTTLDSGILFRVDGASSHQEAALNTTSSFEVNPTNTGSTTVSGVANLINGSRHHIVLTYADTGDTVTVYVDGVSVGTSLVTGSNRLINIDAIFLGQSGINTSFLSGVFDEFAIYPTALSGARVAAHFAAGDTPPDQTVIPAFVDTDGGVFEPTLSQPSVEVSEVERPIPGRRLYPAPQIRVGGMWLSTIAGWGDLEVKHGRNGPFEATWNMALGDTERPSPLIRNARVEIYAGPTMVWCGCLGQPDWDAKSFAAIGIARQAEGAECMTSGGAITSKPNTAIDQAAARDVVWWTRAGDFGNTDIAGVEGDVSNDDPDPGKLTDLLDLWARENDSQWRVTADGRLVIDPEDETEPDWLILPGVGVLGEADDDVADRVFIRYNDSTAGKIRYASYPASTPANGIERRGSVVKRGPMTSTRALAIATGMYRQAQAGRIGWTNGIEVTDQQIITKGGHPANLALIRAGQTVRMLDTPDPRNGGRNLDFVIGESTWRPVERTVQLNPVGMVKRTWEELLADNRLEAA